VALCQPGPQCFKPSICPLMDARTPTPWRIMAMPRPWQSCCGAATAGRPIGGAGWNTVTASGGL